MFAPLQKPLEITTHVIIALLATAWLDVQAADYEEITESKVVQSSDEEPKLPEHVKANFEKARLKLIEKYGDIPEVHRYVELDKKLRIKLDNAEFMTPEEEFERATLQTYFYPNGLDSDDLKLWDPKITAAFTETIAPLSLRLLEADNSRNIKAFRQFLTRVQEREIEFPKLLTYGRIQVKYDGAGGMEQLSQMCERLEGAHILSFEVESSVEEPALLVFTIEYIISDLPYIEEPE